MSNFCCGYIFRGLWLRPTFSAERICYWGFRAQQADSNGPVWSVDDDFGFKDVQASLQSNENIGSVTTDQSQAKI